MRDRGQLGERQDVGEQLAGEHDAAGAEEARSDAIAGHPLGGRATSMAQQLRMKWATAVRHRRSRGRQVAPWVDDREVAEHGAHGAR